MNREPSNERIQNVLASCHALGESIKPFICVTRRAYIMSRILEQLVRTYGQLQAAAAEENIQYTAFAARNILELSIWASFSLSSDENAERFFQDAARDGLSLIAGFEKVKPRSFEADSVNPLSKSDSAKGDLTRAAGIEEGDVQYYNVARASGHNDLFGRKRH